ncbi:leptin receptor gene-related protein-like isoform X1 [Lampetra fluviatilis]
MAMKALLGLSFGGALGLVLLGLACALPMYNVFWPLLVLPFHALAPVPELLWRRVGRDSDTGSSLGREITLFFIAGAVTSAFGLPIILAHASVVGHRLHYNHRQSSPRNQQHHYHKRLHHTPLSTMQPVTPHTCNPHHTTHL